MHHNLISALARGLISRTTGPLKFRFVLQPSMAIFLAIRSGIADGRAGRPPFFWEYCVDPAMRKMLRRDCWRAIEKLFLLACILDCVYQVIELRWIYPVDALAVAVLLAVVPYVAIRGPVNRIVTAHKLASAPPTQQTEAPTTARRTE